MARQRKSDEGTENPQKKQVDKKKEAEEEPDDDKNKFGGLPDRDLKKNLGCGG